MSEGPNEVRQSDYGVYRQQGYSPCHVCGYTMDAASEHGARGKPTAGDIGICFRCGAASVFTGIGLTLRAPTPEEAAELASDIGVLGVQASIRNENPLGWKP